MALKKEDRYESALVAIGSIGGPMAASYLLEALPNLPIRAKIEVIDILGPIGDNRAVPILCELLRSSVSISVRRHAAMALKYFRDPRSRSALMEIITSNFVIPDKENITQSSAWDIYYESKMSLWHLSGQPEMHDFRFPVIPTQSELIEILIEKSPEPEEGVEAWLRNFEKRQSHHPLSMMPMEPTLFSFVIPIQYKKAHDDLLSRAKHSETAVLVVEELVNRYLRGTDSSKAPKGAAAIKMIVEIGDPAIPALENFIRHGSGGISSNAIECLRQITSNRTK
jgi:HEAT repeat protein